MAIRNDNNPPTRSSPGSITKAADAQMDRIGNISNVSKTVSNMQKDVKQKITETKKMAERSSDISAIQQSMTTVLDKLGDTVAALSAGVKTVTIDTARATKDAIGEYSKAISQDISFNKQNVVAMALAKSTPIYGYFVAKFMETDVFKRAAERMKQSIGNAFGSLAKVFRRGGKPEKATPVPKELRGKQIPHMAKGGVVGKGGLAKVHAAEVVMPIDKILDRIDESSSVSKNVMKIMSRLVLQHAASTKAMTGMIQHPDDAMFGQKKKPGVIRDFFKIMREEKDRTRDPINVRQLRELIAIREVLGGELKVWPEVWSRLLDKHPMFRNMIAMSKVMFKLVGLVTWKPIYAIFKSRGGYQRYLSHKDEPLSALNQNIGVLFVESMWRYDNMLNLLRAIAIATRDTASVITGKKYDRLKGMGTGEWSIAGATVRLAGLLTGGAMSLLGKIPGLGFMGKGGGALTRAALTGHRGGRYALGMSEEGGRGGGMTVTEVNIDNIRDAFETYYLETTKYMPIQRKMDVKLLEHTEQQSGFFSNLKKKMKGSGWLNWIFIGFNFLKGMWDRAFGSKIRLLKSLLTPKMMGTWAAGIIGSAAVGYAIGTVINKKLIAPLVEKINDRLDKKYEAAAKESHEAVQAKNKEDWKNFKNLDPSADMASFKSMKRAKLTSGMLGAEGRTEQLSGFFGEIHLTKISEGQLAYRDEHINEYLAYDTDEIRALRVKWLKLKPRTRGFTEDPTEYGRTREKSFLMYVKQNLKPMTPESLASQIETYTNQRRDAVLPTALSNAKGKMVNVASKAKAGASALLAEGVNYLTALPPKVQDAFLTAKQYYVNEFGWSEAQADAVLRGISVTAGNSINTLTDPEKLKQIGMGLYSSMSSKASQAKAGAAEFGRSALTQAGNLGPKARDAFQTAKKYYIKEFGWSEAQADQFLQSVAASSGGALDMLSDPNKLKQFGSTALQVASGYGKNIKDKVGGIMDKGAIVINEAALSLANGELIADDLGQKILDSSKALGEKTMAGAQYIANNVTNVVSNSTNSNRTTVAGGGSGSQGTMGRDFYDRQLYTGNYR